MKYDALENTLSYHFNNKELLKKALTHASKSTEHLERQEFLGDAVLGLAVAQFLYQKHPEFAEGVLSKMRANLVCKKALHAIAVDWKLADFLLVGDGERTHAGVLKSKSIAANAVEAVLGAVFEDSGFSEAQHLVLRAWKRQLADIKPVNLRDAKSKLQEITQSKSLGLPHYEVQDKGVDKTPRFYASCFLNQQMIGAGAGNRKKDAEINAAKEALNNSVIQQLMD